jgi:hypothetical protein
MNNKQIIDIDYEHQHAENPFHWYHSFLTWVHSLFQVNERARETSATWAITQALHLTKEHGKNYVSYFCYQQTIPMEVWGRWR